MELRFRYGKIDSNFEYSDSQLAKIDVHLDEDQIRQQLADGYKGCLSGLGRKPLDSVIGYKAHLLYFLKRDIISFNELPKQIAKDADYGLLGKILLHLTRVCCQRTTQTLESSR